MGLFKRPKLVKLTSDEQDALLRKKKSELEASKDQILDSLHETKNLTMEIIERLKSKTSKIKLALKSSLNENYDKGIIFLSHRGDVLFVNKLVVDTFGVPQTKLVGTKVDHGLIENGGKHVSIKINECSAILLEKILASGAAALPMKNIGACFGKQQDDNCTFVLSNGEVIGPFKAEIVLLDDTPKTLSDITYIVYTEPSGKKRRLPVRATARRSARRGG